MYSVWNENKWLCLEPTVLRLLLHIWSLLFFLCTVFSDYLFYLYTHRFSSPSLTSPSVAFKCIWVSGSTSTLCESVLSHCSVPSITAVFSVPSLYFSISRVYIFFLRSCALHLFRTYARPRNCSWQWPLRWVCCSRDESQGNGVSGVVISMFPSTSSSDRAELRASPPRHPHPPGWGNR